MSDQSAYDPEFEIATGEDEYNPLDPVLHKLIVTLTANVDAECWTGALLNARDLINTIQQSYGNSALIVTRDNLGYHVVAGEHRFAIAMRWAASAMEYVEQMIEMGYEPTEPDMIDKLLRAIKEEEPAYNEWLDDQADRWTS